MRDVFGLPCLVAINHRAEDSEAELNWLQERATHHGVKVIVARHYAEGGKGAVEVAKEVVELCEPHELLQVRLRRQGHALGQDEGGRAPRSTAPPRSRPTARFAGRSSSSRNAGYGHYPICVAKTQYSFSTDPKLRGAPHGHVVNVREVRLAAGAEFVVMICGDIMTMPGLPEVPAANAIDVTDDGKITGLF